MQITTGKNGGYWAAIRKNDVHDGKITAYMKNLAYLRGMLERRNL